MRWFNLLILPIVVSSGAINVFILGGDWNTVCDSTTAKVAVSSCAVMMGDPADCYKYCVNPNGTLYSGPKWMTCP